MNQTDHGFTVELLAVEWPEVRAGDDLATLLLDSVSLADGDVVAVTSKVVSKAEGRAVAGPRMDAVAGEALRVLARRGDSVIAETRHGLVMAAAGVDSSNLAPGSALLLPLDPDDSARTLRSAVHAAAGVNVAIVVTDTAGRAWRNGQVDIAIGCAGLSALTDLSGTVDPYGNVLVVTSPAIADEVASATDLVKGKTKGRPVAVVRGLRHLVLPPGDHGLGAVELVRPSELDLFGLGAREAAVAAALRDDDLALAHFPPRMPVDPPPFVGVISTDPDVRVAVRLLVEPTGWQVRIAVHEGATTDAWLHAGRLWERCAVLSAAYRLTFRRPGTGVEQPPTTEPGWHTVLTADWVVA